MKYLFGILVLPIALLVSCSEEKTAPAIVFVDSVRLFEEFNMKKEYDRILETDLKQESSLMDSIRILMENADDSMTVF